MFLGCGWVWEQEVWVNFLCLFCFKRTQPRQCECAKPRLQTRPTASAHLELVQHARARARGRQKMPTGPAKQSPVRFITLGSGPGTVHAVSAQINSVPRVKV
jgi:hypothetical protein